jgi:hypothetical protein
MEDTDTQPGGETSLSVEQAAAAYAKTLTPDAASDGQAEDDELEQGTETDEELQTSDEDEGEDANGEDDPDSQADEDEDAEPETERGRYVAHNGRVKLPDGSESTVSDLIAGNMKDGDYRQKTTEAANLKREAAAEKEALSAQKQQLEQYSTYLSELARSIVPEMPGPEMLQTDPQGYLQQRALAEQWQQHLAYLDSQRQMTAQERQAEAEQERGKVAEREWNALVERVPAFKDKAKWTAFANDVNKFGAEYGFKPEELRGLAFDHRQMIVIRKAIQWDKLQASKPKVQQKVEGRPAVQKGGKRLNPAEHRARNGNEALARLKQSGSVEDATAAYIASLNKG